MSNPIFTLTATNPFGLSDVGNSASPTFVDIDDDGDLDAPIGNSLGNTIFFINSQSHQPPRISAPLKAIPKTRRSI